MLMSKDDLQFYVFLLPFMRLFIKSKRHFAALSYRKSIDLLLHLNYKTASHHLQDQSTAALQAACRDSPATLMCCSFGMSSQSKQHMVSPVRNLVPLVASSSSILIDIRVF